MVRFVKNEADTPGEAREFLERVRKANGENPLPSVSPVQIRRAIRRAGATDRVSAALESMSEEDVETWEYAVEVDRNDPVVDTLLSRADMSRDEVDDLFREAAKL